MTTFDKKKKTKLSVSAPRLNERISSACEQWWKHYFSFREQSDGATGDMLLLRKILYLWAKRQEAKDDKRLYTEKKRATWLQAVNREEPSPWAATFSLIVKTLVESYVRAELFMTTTDLQSFQNCMIKKKLGWCVTFPQWVSIYKHKTGLSSGGKTKQKNKTVTPNMSEQSLRNGKKKCLTKLTWKIKT